MQTLGTKSEKSSDICGAWKQVEKVFGLKGLTKVILPNQYLQQAWLGILELWKLRCLSEGIKMMSQEIPPA